MTHHRALVIVAIMAYYAVVFLLIALLWRPRNTRLQRWYLAFEERIEAADMAPIIHRCDRLFAYAFYGVAFILGGTVLAGLAAGIEHLAR